MWDFLSGLPVFLSATIIFLIISAIVIISLRGRLKAKIGDKTVVIGDNDNDKSPTTVIPKPITTKRDCGDCILIIMAEREKYELKFRKEKDRILKTQMVFVEHKIIELQTIMIKKLMDKIKASGTSYDFSVQHKLILGILHDSFIMIKDEFRRSFKDNGFYDYNGSDMTNYIRNQTNIITNLVIQHITNIYPDDPNILSATDIVKNILEMKQETCIIINDIYIHAKDTKTDIEGNINEIGKQFSSWVNSFIG